MKDVILEIDKMEDIYVGLGQFCWHLKEALLKYSDGLDIGFYQSRKRYHHRFLSSLLPPARVWHALHQEACFIPNRGKLVLTIHDMNYLLKKKRSYMVARRYVGLLQKKIKRADRVVFISRFARDSTLQFVDIPSAKISVIYNGVAVAQNMTKPSFRLPVKFFLTIGRLLPKKNFHTLVDMMKYRQEALIIAGDYSGHYGEMILERIREKKLQDRVFLVGLVNEEEKSWLFNHCEAFLFPSLFEGFGLPVVESMARGKPTFSSQETSLPEVCGQHAYYFQSFEPRLMAETIERGLSDFTPERAHQMINWTKRYSWKEAAREYLTIYRELLESGE